MTAPAPTPVPASSNSTEYRLDPIEVDCPTCKANREAACHTVGAVTRKMKSFHAERIAEARAMDDEMARRHREDEEQVGPIVPPRGKRFVLKTFEINGAKFVGYTDGSLWNGWDCPLFPRDVADKIAAAYHGRYIEDEDAFEIPIEGSDEEPDRSIGETIIVDGRSIRVYPIGAWAWTWEVA